MALDADEEILQDFLVEAGEILEQLSEQLVELEQHPQDTDLLNAIFRGFHTVKGGAGFLQLDALVDCCHAAENVFDTLRNGKREVDSDLMDVVLQALDNVNAMFAQVRSMEDPVPADPALLGQLAALAEPASSPTASNVSVEEGGTTPADFASEATRTAEGDITDDEFEQLLDALEGDEGAAPASGPVASDDTNDDDARDSDEITDDEFESLLDELHGQGQFKGVPEQSSPTGSGAEADVPKRAAAGDGDEITDDEFEALLDQLHGKGRFDGDVAADLSPGEQTAADDQPAARSGGRGADGENISEDEFEALLDDLHGVGKGPGTYQAGKSKPGGSDPAGGGNVPPRADGKTRPVKGGGGAGATPEGAPSTAAKAKAAPANGGAREGTAMADTTVRVDTKRLDDIMNMVGELVLVRNRLQRLGDEIADEHMQKAVSHLDVVTSDLQSAVMQTRMQPIKKVFGRFPRVVRDLARNLKKEINLVLRGEDTDLDKNLVEALSDPLVHLVRNAVDHGIETPEIREANGKPRVGRVVLSAEQEGDHILLSIEDDGAGMDPDKLRQKAIDKGLFDPDVAERLTPAECFNIIFMPGFSTRDEISDVSGRGVGMDVVKTKISQLNGSLNVTSELGKGSRIVIKVPLTLAIMPTLMVNLGEQSFALPLVNVVEIFHLDLTKKNIVDGRECIVVRDKVFPLFHVKRWLLRGAAGEPEPETGHVVIVAVGTKRVGFVVDQLVGQEEVVIKPLGSMLHGTPGIAGATITGDGRIALIIDVPSLIQKYAR